VFSHFAKPENVIGKRKTTIIISISVLDSSHLNPRLSACLLYPKIIAVISEWFFDILLLALTSLDKQPQLLVLPLIIAEPIIFFSLPQSPVQSHYLNSVNIIRSLAAYLHSQTVANSLLWIDYFRSNCEWYFLWCFVVFPYFHEVFSFFSHFLNLFKYLVNVPLAILSFAQISFLVKFCSKSEIASLALSSAIFVLCFRIVSSPERSLTIFFFNLFLFYWFR